MDNNIIGEEMDQNEKQYNEHDIIRDEDIIAKWQVPEIEHPKKSKRWFISACVMFGLMLAYSIYTKNYLFSILLAITAVIIIMRDSQQENMVDIYLTHEGIKLGRKFYYMDDFKRFAIIYKPNEDKKALAFEFKNFARPRLYIPILNLNPVPLRESLLLYLDEDLELDDLPLTDSINRLLKL